MDEYGKIKKSILSEVADEIRKAAGLTRELTPVEMIYWLKRIIYLPQGHANSELELKLPIYNSASSGTVLEVVRSTANSAITLNLGSFESAAFGALQEE